MKKSMKNKIAIIATALVSIFSNKGSAVQLDNSTQNLTAVGGAEDNPHNNKNTLKKIGIAVGISGALGLGAVLASKYHKENSNFKGKFYEENNKLINHEIKEFSDFPMFKNSGRILDKVRELCANKEEFISKMDSLSINKDNKQYLFFKGQKNLSDLLLTDEIKNQNKDNIFNSFKCLFDGLSGKVKLLKCGSAFISNGVCCTCLIFENSKRYRIDYLDKINSFVLCQLNDGNEITDNKVYVKTAVGFKIS